MCRLRTLVLSFIAIYCSLSNPANAAVLLAVDFGRGLAQDGFSSFRDGSNVDSDYFTTDVLIYDTDGPFTNLYGDLTVTVDAPNHRFAGRNRGPVSELGTFSESELLRSFLSADSIFTTVTGLSANATYKVSVWSYDSAGPQSLSDWRANGVLVKDDYVYNRGTPHSNDDYRFDFIIHADAQGQIQINAIGDAPGNDGPRINGLRIEEAAAVPEPASVVLFSASMLGLVFGARRAKRRSDQLR